MESKYIVAIEVGSSLVKGAIGVVNDIGTLKVCAVETREIVDCVRYGCIQNVEEVRGAVADIILALENHSNIYPRKVQSVYVSLGGRSLMSYKRDLERDFAQETEITNEVIYQMLDEARLEPVADKEIVEVLPAGYMVDNKKNANPVGTYGHNLKMALNIIACRPQIIKNIKRVLEEKMQLNVNDFVVRQMAIAKLVLTSNEIQLGCVLVDLGAETTTISVHKGEALQSLVTIPMGSRNITRDLTSLSITEEQAEKIKCDCVNVNSHEVSVSGAQMVVEGIDDGDISKYVQSRAGEIVANIAAQIRESGLKNTDLPEGIILVGRGAKRKGFNILLESNTSLKVRSGQLPSKIQIADNSINPNDEIDVISILYAATQSNQDAIVECLSEVSKEENDIVEIGFQGDSDDDDNQEGIDDGYSDEVEVEVEEDKVKEKAPKQPKGPTKFQLLMEKLKSRLAESLSEEDDDEDDEDDK